MLGEGGHFVDWVEFKFMLLCNLVLIVNRGLFYLGFGSDTHILPCARVLYVLASGFMHWQIGPNHKVGKMFSAPSHAVRSIGCDLGQEDVPLL